MQSVGAGSELVRSHPLSQAVLRGEVRRKDLNFADHFKRRIDIRLQALCFRLIRDNTVKHNLVFKVDSTVNTMAKLAALNARSDEEIVVNLARSEERRVGKECWWLDWACGF